MPNRVSPGIVNVTDFVAAHAKKFGSYINYIDRDEAIRIDHFDQQNILSVDGYNHYMENPKNLPASSLTSTIIWHQCNGLI